MRVKRLQKVKWMSWGPTSLLMWGATCPAPWDKIVLCSAPSDTTLVDGNSEQRFLCSCSLTGRGYFQKSIENVKQIGLAITSWPPVIKNDVAFYSFFLHKAVTLFWRWVSGRRLWVEAFLPRSSGSVTHNEGTPSPGEHCQPISLLSQFTSSTPPRLQRKLPLYFKQQSPVKFSALINLHSNASKMTLRIKVVS